MAVISISGLAKEFGSTRALDGFDLNVESGEVHGFLGPNGAGKSTTIRILLGLLRRDAGEVSLLDGDPWDDAVQLHRRLAYVPDDVRLWPNLTGGEVIDLFGMLRGDMDLDRRAEMIESTRSAWATSTSRSCGASLRAAAGVCTGVSRPGRRQRVGNAYIHSAVDNHSRLAHSEVLGDERPETALAFWPRALDWFAQRGAPVQRALTDNGSAYRSHLFNQLCVARDVKRRFACPYRPQTSAKVERVNRTLLEEWARRASTT